LGGYVPPQPSAIATVLQIGAGSFVQQSFWKQTWPAPQLAGCGAQTPLSQVCLVKVVPWQVAAAHGPPHEPPQPSSPHSFP